MRRFATTDKFWEIWIDGSEVLTRFGKLGANGQTKVKSTGSPAAARAELERMVEEETGQGFVEQGKAKSPRQQGEGGEGLDGCGSRADGAARRRGASVSRLGLDGWDGQDPAFDMLGATEAETSRWFDFVDSATS